MNEWNIHWKLEKTENYLHASCKTQDQQSNSYGKNKRGRTLGEEDAESRGGVWDKEWVKSGGNSRPGSLVWLRWRVRRQDTKTFLTERSDPLSARHIQVGSDGQVKYEVATLSSDSTPKSAPLRLHPPLVSSAAFSPLLRPKLWHGPPLFFLSSLQQILPIHLWWGPRIWPYLATSTVSPLLQPPSPAAQMIPAC